MAKRHKKAMSKKSSKLVEKYPKDVLLVMNEVKNKLHRWRLCSKGHHFRGGTTQKIGKKDLSVWLRPPIWKCVKSSGRKDLLYAEEIIVISTIYFGHLSGPPSRRQLEFGKKGSKYDPLIRGWTWYWNDILKPKKKLDPDLVKALIASESSFNAGLKNGLARGLMQIMEPTRRILRNSKGELRNHLIVANKEEILNPAVNICSGIRWLFRKREIVTARLKRTSTWEEAVADYKSYWKE